MADVIKFPVSPREPTANIAADLVCTVLRQEQRRPGGNHIRLAACIIIAASSILACEIGTDRAVEVLVDAAEVLPER